MRVIFAQLLLAAATLRAKQSPVDKVRTRQGAHVLITRARIAVRHRRITARMVTRVLQPQHLTRVTRQDFARYPSGPRSTRLDF